MREQMQTRLEQLYQEHTKCEEVLRATMQRVEHFKTTLANIAGAILVLEELLKKEATPSEVQPRQPEDIPVGSVNGT